jgi:mono/diheme cytochrome c family protein
MGALLTAGSLLWGPALADDMQVSAGHDLAVQWCSSCHVVAADQARPGTDGVPSFVAIADDPATTEAGLRAFLGTPHSSMPDISLSRQETSDLIAYLMSLKGQ